MNRKSGVTDKARHSGASDERARASRPQEPATWVETLAGIVPFLFLGLWAITNAWLRFMPDVWLRFVWGGLLLVGYLVMLLLLPSLLGFLRRSSGPIWPSRAA